jgi:hypothetical protein
VPYEFDVVRRGYRPDRVDASSGTSHGTATPPGSGRRG